MRLATAFGLVTAILAGGCTARHAPYDESAHPFTGASAHPLTGASAHLFTAAHVAEGAGPGRTDAVFTVADAASRLEIRTADLPGLLYRVTTPAGSGLAPQVDGPAGRPRLRLRPTGDSGPDVVTVLLNRTVRWTLATPHGGGEQILDLRAGRLTGARLGAAGRVDLVLPAAPGPVGITLAGPVGSLAITAPRGTPVQVRPGGRVAASAGRVSAAAGPVPAAAGRRRYVVTARGTVTTITVRN